MADITGKHAERFNKALDEMPDTEFIKTYVQVLSYFRPNNYVQMNQTISSKDILSIFPDAEDLKEYDK